MDPSEQPEDKRSAAEAGTGAGHYTVECLAEITGISRRTILLYREHGIIRPADADASRFDDEALYALRRIEHLRDACEMNLAGLKVLASLLDEVEALRSELRLRR